VLEPWFITSVLDGETVIDQTNIAFRIPAAVLSVCCRFVILSSMEIVCCYQFVLMRQCIV